MKKILDIITQEVEQAFEACGYDKSYAKVVFSNRPDLCDYQCNGAMAAAKNYKIAPIQIANVVTEKLQENVRFQEVTAIMPGFINIKIAGAFLTGYLNDMAEDATLSLVQAECPRTIMVDYGGANIAKPLHIGHLRSAIIGECIKRLGRKLGHEVIGDVHLGDWGLQMGLIITEVKNRQPELVYFDKSYEGEYPNEAPFTIAELEEIYPIASSRSKSEEAFREEAMQATYLLQNRNRGYMALWNHILNVSIADLKMNYNRLNVVFDLWKKESDAQPYIPEMVDYLKANGYAYIETGALIVDVKEEKDTKEIPPCIILKSDGASLYSTTDLATIVERMKLYNPDEIIYCADKRQELHFEQVFRCARKTNLVKDATKLRFLGFGTMNGKDGKPFKTRDGGVMRLESLLNQIYDNMFERMVDGNTTNEEEAKQTAEMVALAALKYGDLSNQASKNYIFDIERFISSEGNTGPYILYTIVRINSILNKYKETKGQMEISQIKLPVGEIEKSLMLELAKFNMIVENAFEELAPHKICSYIYDLANAFNRFYNDTKIIVEENEEKQKSWIALLVLAKKVLEECIEILGCSSPERM
jgi:arginyl-tRNA synthetase